MSCFPCFQSKQQSESKEVKVPVAHPKNLQPTQSSVNPKRISTSVNPKRNLSTSVNTKKDDADAIGISSENISAKTFTFRELATATKNFRQECLIGEGGYGRVFKGALQPSGQVVTVKQLDKNSAQGNKEFLVEVMMLSLLHHPNLVDLIGYCADGDQRLLVYEYLPMGSVEDHLLELTPEKKPLDWVTRMKIASGTAQGLEYLHDKANPSVIYRDLKSSNILLDEEYNPKLYDYGLAKLGGRDTHATPRVMGNYGYCAPEYERHGEFTLKSDVYSFGVILLELITGRRALDTNRPAEEQNLVTWAQPFFRDPKRFPEMADPLLGEVFPITSLNQAVGVAAMCLQDEPAVRPLICDVLAALSFLAVAPPDAPIPDNTLRAPADDHQSVAMDQLHQPVGETLQAPINHSSVTVAPPNQSVPNNLQVLADHRSIKVASPDRPVPNIHQAPIDHENVAMAAAVLPIAVQGLTNHRSGDSSKRKDDGSKSMKYEDEDHNQEDRDGSDNESWPSPVSIDVYDDENDGLDFEVASMSSCSISSIDESQHGSFNKIRYNGIAEVQPGNKSSKLKRISTKNSHEGSVHSRHRNEESSYGPLGVGTRSRAQSLSVRTSARGNSSRKLENGGVGLSANQKSSERSKSRNIRSYSRAMSIVEPRNNRKIMSAQYRNKEFEEEKLLTSAS